MFTEFVCLLDGRSLHSRYNGWWDRTWRESLPAHYRDETGCFLMQQCEGRGRVTDCPRYIF